MSRKDVITSLLYDRLDALSNENADLRKLVVALMAYNEEIIKAHATLDQCMADATQVLLDSFKSCGIATMPEDDDNAG